MSGYGLETSQGPGTNEMALRRWCIEREARAMPYSQPRCSVLYGSEVYR